MSKALDLKFGHSERLEAAVDVSPYLYIVLGYLTWKIIDGILGKIGSDVWDKGKQRFVKMVMQHKSASAKPSRVGFEFDYDTTHVSMSVESNARSVIGQAFDKIGDVLKDVRQLAKERNLPGTESEIFY